MQYTAKEKSKTQVKFEINDYASFAGTRIIFRGSTCIGIVSAFNAVESHWKIRFPYKTFNQDITGAANMVKVEKSTIVKQTRVF